MKKKITLTELVFIMVSALFGIRWIARSTAESFGLGLGAIPTWFVFAFIFFVPLSLICAELASTYPKDGGLYEWVKEAYGEKYGFLVSWLNWSSKIFWYGSFLTFLAVNIAFTIGLPELASSQLFVVVFSLIFFWVLSLISMRSLELGKYFTSVGALGSTLPAALLIIMGFVSVVILKRVPSASTYTVATLMPKLNADSMVAISAIMFGYGGVETVANFATEIDNPRKNFPKAVFIAAFIVAFLYIIGSLAITMILPTADIKASTGFLEALTRVSINLGFGTWLIKIVALGISVSILGAIILYIASPIRMLFGSVPEGIFPSSITKLNKYNIPANAVLFQAALVSFIILGINFLPGVDVVYNVLVTMTALTALFPYVLMLAAYIKLRKTRPNEIRPYAMSNSDNVAIGIAWGLFFIIILGIIFSAAPVFPTLKENIIYEIQMIGGGIVIIMSGLYIWKRYENKNKQN